MKNAKKSMFITTILMVAVLIVAVSTATFAWYTSSQSVNATDAVVSSASSTSADISIGWSDADKTTTIALAGGPAIQPMVPTAVIADDAETIAFNTAPMNTLNQFTAAGTNATPWSINVEDKTSFFVINNNINEDVTVKMTATFDGTLADNLCVAVFIDGKVKGVFANNNYKVGQILINTGDAALTDCTYKVLANGTDGITFTLGEDATGSDNEVEISVYAWINGNDLTSINAGQDVAEFAFNFAAQAPVQG